MLFIIALAAAFAFAYCCGGVLKKRPYVFYLLAAAISVTVSAVTFRGLPQFVNTYIVGLFSRGAFATALWAVVMWTGALKNGSKLMKKFMPVRGELSILAAVLTLGHNIGYGKTYFVRLFTNAGSMPLNQLIASILTIAMLIIMLPLTVISFPSIRKKIKARRWKQIQRAAYLFYALIYLHIMTLFMPYAINGRSGYLLNIIVYSVVFIGYAVCRVRKWYLQKNKDFDKRTLNGTCAVAFAVLAVIPAAVVVVNTAKPDSEIVISDSSESISSQSESFSSSAESVFSEIENSDNAKEPSFSADYSQSSSLPEIPDSSFPQGSNESSSASDNFSDTPVNSDAQSSNSADYSEKPQSSLPPEPVYIYNNGTYTAKASGYDGDVKVNVTVENDRIISITGTTYESDPWYYDSAFEYVVPQIISKQTTDVDAYSGATFSSNGIMAAVSKALEKAKK